VSESFAAIEPQIATLERGITKILADAESSSKQSQAATKWNIMAAIVAVTGVVALLCFFIGRAIVNPLSAITAGMKELAFGNFEVILPGIGRKDEIGDIARAVETFKIKAAERAHQDADEKHRREQLAAGERKVQMQALADEFQATVGNIVEMVSSA